MSENTREHIRNLVLILITTVIFIMQYYLISQRAYSAEQMSQVISIGPFSASGLTWCFASGMLLAVFLSVFFDYGNKMMNLKSVRLFYPGWLWLVGTVVSIVAGIMASYYCIIYQYVPDDFQGNIWGWNFAKIAELFQENARFSFLCVVILALLAAELFVWVVECILSYGVSQKHPDQDRFELSDRGSDRYWGTLLWMGLSVILLFFFYGNMLGEKTVWTKLVSSICVLVLGCIWALWNFLEVVDEGESWEKVFSYIPFWTFPAFVVSFIWNVAVCKDDFPNSMKAVFEKVFIFRDTDNAIEHICFVTGIGTASIVVSTLVLAFILGISLFIDWIWRNLKKIKEYEIKVSEISRLNEEIDQYKQEREKTEEKYRELEKEKERLEEENVQFRTRLENTSGRVHKSGQDRDKDIQAYENKVIEKEYQIAQLKKSLEDAKNYATEMINNKSAEVDKLNKELQACREKINQLSSGQSKNDAIQSMNIQKHMETKCKELEREKERLKREIKIYENNVIERDTQIAQLKKSLEDAEKRALEVINRKSTEKKISSTQAVHTEQKSSTFLPFDVILTIHGMDADETVEGFWSHMGMDGKNKAVSQLDLDTLLGDIGIQTGLVLKGMDSVETAYGLKKVVSISGNTVVSVKKQGDITCMEPMEPFNWVLLKGIYDIVVKVENQAEITCMLELA